MKYNKRDKIINLYEEDIPASISHIITQSDTANFKPCILYGINTGVLRTTPVDLRENYVSGCEQCFEELKRSENHTDFYMTNDELEKLFLQSIKSNQGD